MDSLEISGSGPCALGRGSVLAPARERFVGLQSFRFGVKLVGLRGE